MVVVDHMIFRGLLALYAPVFNLYMVDEAIGCIVRRIFFHRNDGIMPKGKHREVNTLLVSCLGLLLYWFMTCDSVARGLFVTFGLTSTVMYKWVKFSRCGVLLFVLQDHPDTRVRAPFREDIDAYVAAISEKCPLLGEQRV